MLALTISGASFADIEMKIPSIRVKVIDDNGNPMPGMKFDYSVGHDQCKTKVHPLYYSMASRCTTEKNIDKVVTTDRNGIISLASNNVVKNDSLIYHYKNIYFNVSLDQIIVPGVTDKCDDLWATDYLIDKSASRHLDYFHQKYNMANNCWINADSDEQLKDIPTQTIVCQIKGYERRGNPEVFSFTKGITRFKKDCGLN